ncbi:MAG: hypothetical protein WEA61_04215 [Anaerolineales bacterium]
MEKRKVFLGIVVSLGLLLAACSGGSSLLGKWEGTEDSTGLTFTFEFKSGGVLEMGLAGITIEGTYEMVDADTFNMTIDMLGQSQTEAVDFSRSGNTLNLTISGDTLEFHKVP